jgi:hypothetical protein
MCFRAGVRWMTVVFCGVLLGGVCLSQLIPFTACLVLMSWVWDQPEIACPWEASYAERPTLPNYGRSTYHHASLSGVRFRLPGSNKVGVVQGRCQRLGLHSPYTLLASSCAVLSLLFCFCLFISCCPSSWTWFIVICCCFYYCRSLVIRKEVEELGSIDYLPIP